MTVYLNERQVAERLTISTSSLRRWVRAGRFPRPLTLSPGAVRWREADLIAWETERAEEATGRAEADLTHGAAM